MERGSPSDRRPGRWALPGGHGNGPCSAKFGLGCVGQCLGRGWPSENAGKACEPAGLRARAPRAFGAEAELSCVELFGSLLAMVVSMGTSEQSG